MEEKIILERFPEIDYVLVYWKANKLTPFVAAWGYNDDGTWCQGHYFTNIIDACDYIKFKKGE